MKTIDKSKKTVFDLSVILAIIGLMFFLPWVILQEDKITDVKLWASIDALVLFFAASVIFFKNFAADFIKDHSANNTEQTAKTAGRIAELKKILVIFGIFAVWGIVVLLLCGFYKMAVTGSTDLWESTETIMRSLDSNQYLYIAENWYTDCGNLATDVSIVFLPGYPVLVKLFYFITGDVFVAGTIVSVACYGLSAVFLYKLVSLDNSHEKAVTALIFFAIIPGVFFYVAPMSESLFLFTILASVYYIRKKNWLAAGIFGCYASFTRSSGVLILAIFVYELALDFWQGEHTKPRFLGALRKLACGIIIPLGLFAYLIINKIVTGDAFKFMYYQKNHWGQRLGFFFNTIHYMVANFFRYIEETEIDVAVALWGMGIFAFFSLLLLFVFQGKKLRTSYLLYSLVYFAFSMGATWLLSAPRYAIGLFTLPIMLADLCDTKNKMLFAVAHIGVLSFVYGIMFVLRWQVW